jgi:hypothetical protein
MLRRTLWVAACLGLSCPVHAQLGKWVDPQGRIYYGDQPPQTLVKERPVSRGAVSMADGAHYRSAPARWQSRSGGSATGIGGGDSAITSRVSSASRGGYWRCGE